MIGCGGAATDLGGGATGLAGAAPVSDELRTTRELHTHRLQPPIHTRPYTDAAQMHASPPRYGTRVWEGGEDGGGYTAYSMSSILERSSATVGSVGFLNASPLPLLLPGSRTGADLCSVRS
jgi:hypothetical protein